MSKRTSSGALVGELILGIILPGVTMTTRHLKVGLAVAFAGIGSPMLLAIWGIRSDSGRLTTLLDDRLHQGLIMVCVFMLVARAVALVEIVRGRTKPASRFGPTLLAVALFCAAGVPLVYISANLIQARAAFDDIFVAVDPVPVFDVETISTRPTTEPEPPRLTLAPPTTIGQASPTTTLTPIDRSQLGEIRTVLLLGGDAGPGRSGLRTDSMILVAIDGTSGRVGLISISRNLLMLRFPPGTPLADLYPAGFPELANAVYPITSNDRELRNFYGAGGRSPGMVATAQALGYSLGVTIDDVVLIDMQGLLDLIDALGGVTVEVARELTMPGNVPGAKHELPPTIGPGVIEMDGTLALGYVRSRHDDSDYQRMRRQRALLDALASQVSLSDVVFRFSGIIDALGGALRTTMSGGEFAALVGIIGNHASIVESVGLVPPLVNPAEPDYAQIERIVADVMLALVTGRDSGY